MIKAIIFDIGGVILETDKLALPVIDAFQPEDNEKFWQELNERFSPLCRGEGNLLDFWKMLAKDHKKNISEHILKKLWIENFKKNLIFNNEVKKLVVALKKSYKLAIISNVIEEHANKFKENKEFCKIKNMFDVVTFSNEVKMTKDSKDIFIYTVEKLGVTPEECVFTDDTKKFVDVAKSIGMKAVQFKNVEQFKRDLKGFGVKI